MNKIRGLAVAAVIILFSTALIFFSDDAKEGVENGLELCKNVLVPSMFPFLVISSFIAESDLSRRIGNQLSYFTSKIFRLPSCCTSVIICGMLFGYPTGAVMTSKLLSKGDIDETTAKRLLRFVVNAGVPFTVLAVGRVMYGSKTTGWILYISVTLSALLMGLLEGFRYPKAENVKNRIPISRSYSDCLVSSVQSASMVMINICAFLLLCGSVDGIMRFAGEKYEYFKPFLEITNGVMHCVRLYPIWVLCFFIAFSGLCIHCQLFPIIVQAKMKYWDFFAHRIAHGILSLAVCKLLMYFFPVAQETFSNVSSVKTEFVSVSLTATVTMVIMMVALLIDLEGKKKKC